MINAKRRRLIAKVEAEKRKAAGIPPSAPIGTTVATQVESRIIAGKHFFIEVQPDETGGCDVYAVYRTVDLLSTVVENDAIETPAPVHVYELATDAAVAMGMLDKLVDQMEGGDVLTPEWPGNQTEVIEEPSRVDGDPIIETTEVC